MIAHGIERNKIELQENDENDIIYENEKNVKELQENKKEIRKN